MADGFAIRTHARKSRCVSDALGGFYIGSRHCNFFPLPIVVAQSGCPSRWPGWSLRAITLINPILYHYFNAKMAAWNNLAVGSVVFILAIYQDRKDSESTKTA